MKTPDSILRVLYADDNADARFMVMTILGFSGIDVKTVETIEEALNLAHSEYFDLYLLDSRFPDGSGLYLCRTLREYAPYTPILFYSSNAYQTDIQNGLAAGANGFLTKPYVDYLTEAIVQAVEHRKKFAVSADNFYVKQTQQKIHYETF